MSAIIDAYLNRTCTCLYDKFTKLKTILSLNQYKMASEIIDPFSTSFATIRADGESVPISFPLGSDGSALVSAIHLGLWFQLNIASLQIDKEVFDQVSGDVTHTIGQIPMCNRDGKHWLLRPGKFRLYGLSESNMAASIELATPLRSSSCTNHTLLSSKVKVRLVILGVRRLTGRHNRRVGVLAYYNGRELGILDIFSKYSLEIPQICSNILEYTQYFLVGQVQRSYGEVSERVI